MVSYQFEELNKIRKNAGVLILIVVDDGLVLHQSHSTYNYHKVLILIVAEDGLVHKKP